MADSFILLTWFQGDPVSRQLRVVDGVAKFGVGEYKAQIRAEQDRDSTLIGEFACTVAADPVTTADLLINLVLTEEQSNDISDGQFYFDVQRQGGRTLGPGIILVNPDVTVWAAVI